MSVLNIVHLICFRSSATPVDTRNLKIIETLENLTDELGIKMENF